MGYYAASSGSFLPTFRDNLSVPNGLDIQTNRQWQNIGSTTTVLLNSMARSLSAVPGYMQRLFTEAVGLEFHPNNMNRKNG